LKKTIKKGCTTCKGFTLVELMIVVAIIGALATVATLGAHSFMPRFRLNLGCMDIMSAFNRARVSAIRNNAGGVAGVGPQCVLVFQPVGTAGALPGGSYFIFMDTDANWIEDAGAGEVRVFPQTGMPHGVELINATFNNNGQGSTFCCAYNSQGLATQALGGGPIVTGSVDMQAVTGSVRVNFTATGRLSKQMRDGGGAWVDHR
jgi:prepilin-type N-terminal cleavage/methylation domain-containing protein